MIRKFTVVSFFILLLGVSTMFFASAKSLKEQDAEYRATIVGKDQVGIERELIKEKNGVFILFTPTHGTPQMISAKNDIPDGLIPAERLVSYDTSVKPRVITTRQMPESGVNMVFIRCKAHRPNVNEPNKSVDETHYLHFLKEYKQKVIEKVIDERLFQQFNEKDMPAAFYFYFPVGQKTPEFAAIFAKQINASIGNKLTDPGVFVNRPKDLENVNNMLAIIGFKSVNELWQVNNMQIQSVINARVLPREKLVN